MIAIWHLVPAVRTGNTVVLKPSPFTRTAVPSSQTNGFLQISE